MQEIITPVAHAWAAAAPYVYIAGASAIVGVGIERLITKSLEALRRDLGFEVWKDDRAKLKGRSL
jgi:hypothetical protein